MSDQDKPEHPAPWRWVDEGNLSWRLEDASGEKVAGATNTGELEMPDLGLRELIRLAPELEQALRESVVRFERVMEMWTYEGERLGDMGDRDKARIELVVIRRLLAALDVARKEGGV